MTTPDPRPQSPAPQQTLGQELRSSLLLFALAVGVTAGLAGILRLVAAAVG
jgi:hypothetical protein